MKFKNTPIIKTKHLTLEFIKDSDLDDLIGLLKNEEVGKTTTFERTVKIIDTPSL